MEVAELKSDSVLRWGSDGPLIVHVARVLSRVVRTHDVPCGLPQLEVFREFRCYSRGDRR